MNLAILAEYGRDILTKYEKVIFDQQSDNLKTGKSGVGDQTCSTATNNGSNTCKEWIIENLNIQNIYTHLFFS